MLSEPWREIKSDTGPFKHEVDNHEALVIGIFNISSLPGGSTFQWYVGYYLVA